MGGSGSPAHGNRLRHPILLRKENTKSIICSAQYNTTAHLTDCFNAVSTGKLLQ